MVCCSSYWLPHGRIVLYNIYKRGEKYGSSALHKYSLFITNTSDKAKYLCIISPPLGKSQFAQIFKNSYNGKCILVLSASSCRNITSRMLLYDSVSLDYNYSVFRTTLSRLSAFQAMLRFNTCVSSKPNSSPSSAPPC